MKLLINLFNLLTITYVLIVSCQKDNDGDEGRPYEFGFTIDGQQHRHEKKDTKGIIQGEFGFITADGIYHVTVYATDENGNFKILSMRNVRISAPLDGSPLPPGAKIESIPGVSVPQQSQSPQIGYSGGKNLPSGAKFGTTPTPQSSQISYSGGNNLPPGGTLQPPQLLPQISYNVDKNLPPISNQDGNKVLRPRPLPLSFQNQDISITTSRPNGPYTFTTQSTIKPACGGCGYVTTIKPKNGQPKFPFQTPQFQNKPSTNQQNYPGTQLNGNVQKNGGSIEGNPPGPLGTFTNSGLANSEGTVPGNQGIIGNSVGPSTSTLTSRVEDTRSNQGLTGFNVIPIISSLESTAGGGNQGSTGIPVNPITSNIARDGNQASTGIRVDPIISKFANTAGGGNQGSTGIPINPITSRLTNTAGGENQGLTGAPVNSVHSKSNDKIVANPLSIESSGIPSNQPENSPPSRLSQVTISDGAIHVPNQDDIPIRDKFPGMNDGLPVGIKETDITDLLYKFHYEVGFHGHYEKGTKSGAKIGGYFVNGRDGVSRVVTYVADENGFQPKFKFIRLGLDETPKPDSEKTFGLKSFEFIWYPVD